jgi:photosystem II stability/assembly factor-like uncharacterized protein
VVVSVGDRKGETIMVKACVLALCVGLPVSVAVAQQQVKTDLHGNRAMAYVDAGATPANPAAGFDAAGWTALGPYGGDVWAVAVSPVNTSIVLAGIAPTGSSGGKMYRSVDGGATWTVVPTLAFQSVFDIEFAPSGTVYAGTMDGVWRSNDGGASFTALNLGIGLNDQTFEVTIDPGNPSVLWAGIADAIGSQPVNVMMSPDGGTTWFNRTPTLPSPQNCRAIAIHPANSQVMGAAFGGSFGGGQVWISTDGGTSWTNRSAGLPGNPMATLVHDGTRFLIGGGQLFGGQAFGLYTSSNLGVNWTPLHDGTWPNLIVTRIALDPANASNILLGTVGGIFRSTTGGTSWSFGVGGTGQISVETVRFAPGSSTQVFLGGDSVGVFKSTDGGGTFAQSSTGISALDVYSIAANPVNTADMAVAFQSLNSGGVFRSLDSGQHWALEAVPPVRWNTVGYSFGGTLYAISDGPTGTYQEALYRRNNDGTWTPIGPNQGSLFESELYALRFSHNNPNLIMSAGGDFGVAGWKGTVWRTTDGGANWTKVYLGPNDFQPVLDLEIVEDGTDQLMGAVYRDNSGSGQGGGLFSVNNGQTWTPASGLPSGVQPTSLSAKAGSPATFLTNNSNFSATQGVFRSTDGGATWSPTGNAQQINLLECDGVDGQTVYAVRPGSGGTQDRVYRSTDGGVAFSLFSDNLPAQDGFGRALVYAGGPSPKLLLATSIGTFSYSLGAACYPNCDGSTTAPVLNVADFTCFLQKFGAGDSYGNCDGSTTAPVLNVADFTCFLNKYAAGCP